jgi:hypothetical protein
VDWDKYGVVNGVARDSRCENCMVHCGYDPSGALGVDAQFGDTWKNVRYNFGPKPQPYYEGAKVQAFNGCSINKGHLAEARQAVNQEDDIACSGEKETSACNASPEKSDAVS